MPSPPGPAEPADDTEIRVDLLASETAARYEDTEFRAALAADVLAYERAQTADTHQRIAIGWDDVASYLHALREAL